MTRALIANPDDPATVVNMNGVSTLKVETSYVDEVAWATEETDEGNQVGDYSARHQHPWLNSSSQQILDAKKDNDLLLDFLGMRTCGKRRCGFFLPWSSSSSSRQFGRSRDGRTCQGKSWANQCVCECCRLYVSSSNLPRQLASTFAPTARLAERPSRRKL